MHYCFVNRGYNLANFRVDVNLQNFKKNSTKSDKANLILALYTDGHWRSSDRICIDILLITRKLVKWVENPICPNQS